VIRLHDLGRSAWWMLIALVPIAGVIVLIAFWALAGDAQPNTYGPPTRSPRRLADPGYPQPSH
jgi:uncharacterized membrane protein YhaH (DUF805 family)